MTAFCHLLRGRSHVIVFMWLWAAYIYACIWAVCNWHLLFVVRAKVEWLDHQETEEILAGGWAPECNFSFTFYKPSSSFVHLSNAAIADNVLLMWFVIFRVPKAPKDKQETEETWESEETQWVLEKVVRVPLTVLTFIYEMTYCV